MASSVGLDVVVLRKVVAQLLMPPALLWLGLVAGWLFLWRERRARWVLGIALVAYTVVGNSWTAYLLLRGLERPYAGIRPLERGPFEAVFVLGGGSSETPAGEPQLGPSGDRIRLGAALWRAGRTRLLVTSGTSLDGERDVSAQTQELWLQMGVPREAVVEVPGPRNTVEEISRYRELVAERGWDRIGLVTSARHMARAQAICRRQGVEMEPLPADFVTARRPSAVIPIVPEGEAFWKVEDAAWEYLGLVAVYLFGG